MTAKNTRQFYRKDGQPLKNTVETISLVATSNVTIDKTLFEEKQKPQKPNILTRGMETFQSVKLPEIRIKLPQIAPRTALTGASAATAAFSVFTVLYLTLPARIRPEVNKYSIYSAKPLTMDTMSYDVYTQDSRSQRINEVFREYNCPLEGMGEKFVHEADEYDIPWWIAPAIAFQESSCGKNTPKLDGGEESYNAWGWAVYGENVHSFNNWARGIETVSEYLAKKFYSQGITEPCEIMKVYTPPSNGSWCEGVTHFKELFENYKTPHPNTL